MKKQFFSVVAILCCSVLLSGCASAFISTKNGFPSATPGVLVTDMNSATMLEKQTIPANYKILGPVEAQAKTVNYAGLFAFGDSSYKYLKRQALEHHPDAKAIINIEIDANHKNILCLVNEVTTIMRGTAITY